MICTWTCAGPFSTGAGRSHVRFRTHEPSSRVVHGNFTEAHRHADQTGRAGGCGPPRPRRRAPLPLRLPLHRAAGAHGMRVLIVEDEVVIAWMLADSLEGAGH